MISASAIADICRAAMVIGAPLMMSKMGGLGDLDIQLSVQQILLLGTLLVAIAFLYSTMIALISVFARSVKEANTYVMPAYMHGIGNRTFDDVHVWRDSQKMFFIPITTRRLCFREF